MSGRPPKRRPPLRDDLVALEGYHSPQLEVEVRLNTNESPYPPPEAFVDELRRELASIEWHRYPDRAAAELRRAIGALHGVGPEQVFVANGSNEVIQTVCLAFAGAGRSVLTFEPTYAMHGQIARSTQSTVLEAERDDAFEVGEPEVDAGLALGDPSVVFACSPNNPTGGALRRSVVEHLVGAAPGLVFVDEAYAQFSSWTACDLVAEDAPVVVSRTFSKTWSMAAARLGYLIGPAWLVERLDVVVLPYHLDAVKQLAGRLALRHTDDMERRVSALVEERGRVLGALLDLDVDVWPSDANFVLFRPRRRAGTDVWQGLVERSVLVRNCSSWPRLAGCLRVTIGTPAENDRFLTSLVEVLAPTEVRS